jgi:hypothetical protein
MLEQPVHVALLEANLQLDQLVAIGTVKLRPLARRKVRLLDGVWRARLDGRRDGGVRSHRCRQQGGREHVHCCVQCRQLRPGREGRQEAARGKSAGPRRLPPLAAARFMCPRQMMQCPGKRRRARPTRNCPLALLYEAAAIPRRSAPPRITCIPGRCRADQSPPSLVGSGPCLLELDPGRWLLLLHGQVQELGGTRCQASRQLRLRKVRVCSGELRLHEPDNGCFPKLHEDPRRSLKLPRPCRRDWAVPIQVLLLCECVPPGSSTTRRGAVAQVHTHGMWPLSPSYIPCLPSLLPK